jgi:hypothetical protein
MKTAEMPNSSAINRALLLLHFINGVSYMGMEEN